VKDTRIDGEVAFAAKQFEKERDYWIKKLSGNPGRVDIPFDYPGNYSIEEKLTDIVEIRFPGELSEQLLKASNRSDTRLHMILVTGLVILLNKYTGSRDIIVGTPIDRQETEGTFINTVLALRNRVNRSMTFKDLLMQVKQTTAEARENMNYPLESIIFELGLAEPAAGEKIFPLLGTAIVLENIQEKSYLKQVPLVMTWVLERKDSHIQGSVEYDPGFYGKASIERMISRYLMVLGQCFADVNILLSGIDILSKEERRQLLQDFNNTGFAYPRDKTVIDLFEDQVARTPGKDAARYEQHRLTYSELKQRVDHLAGMLREKIAPRQVIALMGERNLEIIIGILGILKAGCIYLPIDGHNPEERIKFILHDSGARVLLSQEPVIRRKAGCLEDFPPGNILALDRILGDGFHPASSPLSIGVKPGDIAYIIYTSGTTGKPRGVTVQHRALVNYTWWAASVYVREQPVDFALYTSIGFDLTLTSIFTPLITGNAVVVYTGWDKEVLVERVVDDNQASVIKITPSHLKLLKDKKIRSADCRIKRFIVGGEELETGLARTIHDNFQENIEIYNEYGPTEATVGCMIHRYNPGEDTGRTVPIGTPSANMQIYLLDEDRNPVPGSGTGEMYISGESLALGYLNRPELTSRKFTNDNRSYRSYKSYLYQTGDTARWNSNGQIEFLGRKDDQVKIRGFRIELGEIEHRLLEHEAVKEAAAITKKDESGENYLCAYVVCTGEITGGELREYLLKDLPDYMVPSFIMPIDAIPLTANGKVNKRALPEPAIEAGAAYVPPGNEIEKKLVETWAEILGLNRDSIGIDDDYFQIGGHSLRATVLAAKIHKEFNKKVSLVNIFNMPTIRSLARYLQESVKETFISVKPVEKREYYPLSSSQGRLYVLQQIEAIDNVVYNIPLAMEIQGNLDREKFQWTIQELLRRHESLRTSFEVIHEEPVQRIHDKVEFEIEYSDLATEDTESTEKKNYKLQIPNQKEIRSHHSSKNRITHNSFIRPFDLSRAPLMRVGLIELPHTPSALRGHPSQEGKENKCLLMLDFHHIITDGVSMEVFTRDFMMIYGGKIPPALGIQYKDYTLWINSETERKNLEKQETYWLNRFDRDIPRLELPLDYLRPAEQTFAGNWIFFDISPADTKMLRKLAKSEEVTLYMLMLALFNILLSKISGQEHIMVGTPVAGRRHTDLEPLMGVFINTLVMQNFPHPGKPCSAFLKEVKETAVAAFENQEYSFEELVRKLTPDRDVSRNPIFDVLFEFQSKEEFGRREEAEIPGLKIKSLNTNPGVSKFDMTLRCMEEGETIKCLIEYCTHLFKKETIRRIIRYFQELIPAVTNNPLGEIREMDITSGEEQEEILFAFNKTEREFPGNKVLHQVMEEQVEKTPDNIAIAVHETQETQEEKLIAYITYKELNKTSNQLAHYLRQRGIRPDITVGIMTRRSLAMVIGVLGVLKSSGAYLPIDVNYPEARVNYLIKDSGIFICLTGGQGGQPVPKDVEIINLDAPNGYRSEAGTGNLQMINTPGDLAYVIYTSGSTGIPKGVGIRHGSVVNILAALQQMYPLGPTHAYMLKTSYTFDVSVTELFGWFWEGGRLVIPGGDVEKNPAELFYVIEQDRVTHINFVPSLFDAAVDLLNFSEIGKLSPLKYIFLAGEALLPALVNKFKRLNTGIRLENIYGPTEAAIYTSWYSLSWWDSTSKIPIGKPLPNIKIFILDRDNRPQPVSIVGELCIAGLGLARGYLNNPELTREKFIFYRSYRSYMTYIPKKLYKTGDLARWLADGTVEYLGRMDHQVKVRGFRIELEEIESKLLMYPGIKKAVVVVQQRGNSFGGYLCAYITAETPLEEPTLADYLAAELPRYMVPAYFIFLEQLPVTPSGKLDRKALPMPEIKAGSDYIAPGDYIEEKIAESWSEVLGIKKSEIGIHDNFFQLGGDSINAIQVSAKLLKYGLNLKSRDVFLHPCIKELSRCVHRVGHVIRQGMVEGEVPFTAVQRWFLEKRYTHPHHFNQAVMLFKADGFDEKIIDQVFKKILEHHDALRMVYPREGNTIIQRNRAIEDQRLFDLQVKDLKDKKDIAAEIERAASEIQSRINLETGPLVKLMLFHTHQGSHLLIAVHHLVIDGVSWRILLEDFTSGYKQLEQGTPGTGIQLAAKTDSFQYWAERINRYGSSREILEEPGYWQGLAKKSTAPLPRGHKIDREKKKRKYSELIRVTLSTSETGQLIKEANAAYNTEVNHLLLTALGMAVRQWAGLDHVLLSLEGHGREEILEDVNVNRTIGWFTSIFPVLLDMSLPPADPTGNENQDETTAYYIKSVKENLKNIPNRGVNYGILRYLTANTNHEVWIPDIEPGIIFNYLGHFNQDEQVSGKDRGMDDSGIKISQMSTGHTISPENEIDFTFNISGLVADRQLVISIEYNRYEYEKADVEEFAHAYKSNLLKIIRHCVEKEDTEMTLSDLSTSKLKEDELMAIYEDFI